VQATLPTGGMYQYDYPSTTPVGCASQASGCQYPYVSNNSSSGTGINEHAVLRRVTARRVYTSSSTLEGRTCYAPVYSTSGSTYTIDVTHLDGSATDCTATVPNTVSTETHIINGDPFSSYWSSPPDTWYESAASGRENQMSWNTAAGAALKTVNTTWQDSGPNSQDATACQVLTTLSGTSSATSGTVTVYDQYFNVRDVYEYDFGNAPTGTTCPTTVPTGWGRHTHTAYEPAPWADAATSGTNSNHMRSLVQEKDVYSSAGQAAMTTYGYDESTPSSAPGIPGGNTAPAHSKRGNRTSAATHLDATTNKPPTNPPTTTYAYDVLGNVTTITDPRSYQTTVDYTDRCSAGPGGTLDAFPTTVTDALSHSVLITYDCYIGKQTNFQDANGVSTSYSYDGCCRWTVATDSAAPARRNRPWTRWHGRQ